MLLRERERERTRANERASEHEHSLVGMVMLQSFLQFSRTLGSGACAWCVFLAAGTGIQTPVGYVGSGSLHLRAVGLALEFVVNAAVASVQ